MLLQSLLRPVLTPLMRGMFDAPIASSAAWSPLSLWPDGILSPGMWISPRTLTSEWQDYTGTTPVVTPGTVADSANPVGLALDIRAGATVLTDPGNHMLQSTSAARPLMSARRNLLTATEDLGNASWQKGGGAGSSVTTTNDYGIAPDGSQTAIRVNMERGSLYAELFQRSAIAVGTTHKLSIWVKSLVGTPTVGITWSNISYEGVTTLTESWVEYEFDLLPQVSQPAGINFTLWTGLPTTSAAADFLVWHPQSEIGSTVTTYQRVGSTDADYATGFPIAQLYDGVDDGMATAAFPAGTLINGMDCMIAVRRDSAAACVAGLYNGIADATKFFGMAESGSGSGCVGSGAGTATVWVDGVQLSGGTAVTRGTLHTALTVGDWHILEFRGLDLSAWTAAGFGLYTSYVFPGARGDIMLYPSTASTEDKDAARQYLADYYGVTLP
jgi:hypothetical protein